jgi:hypothetical protein
MATMPKDAQPRSFPSQPGKAAESSVTASLSSVKRGRTVSPDRIILVGTEGLGKTTFAAGAPAPIFIAVEDGLRHVDVAHFPQPKSFNEVLADLAALAMEEHDYKTCVIDTVDWVGLLIQDAVMRRNDWSPVQFDEYGRGYKVWVQDWRRLLVALDRLRAEKGMEIILLAHASISTFKNPTGPDYQRYGMKIGGVEAPALLKEWADMVLFGQHVDTTEEKRGRVRGISSGERIIQTERTAAWDAKNRHNLPPTLALDYAELDAARKGGYAPSADELYAACQGIIKDSLNGAPGSPIHAFLETNRADVDKLTKALNTLREKAAQAAPAGS